MDCSSALIIYIVILDQNITARISLRSLPSGLMVWMDLCSVPIYVMMNTMSYLLNLSPIDRLV